MHREARVSQAEREAERERARRSFAYPDGVCLEGGGDRHPIALGHLHVHDSRRHFEEKRRERRKRRRKTKREESSPRILPVLFPESGSLRLSLSLSPSLLLRPPQGKKKSPSSTLPTLLSLSKEGAEKRGKKEEKKKERGRAEVCRSEWRLRGRGGSAEDDPRERDVRDDVCQAEEREEEEKKQSDLKLQHVDKRRRRSSFSTTREETAKRKRKKMERIPATGKEKKAT